MKRGTESIVRLGKSVEPADFSGINVLSTVILGKKESATKDFNGLFITDAVLLGKKISHAAVVTATVHGVSPLSLPSAVANSLSYVKAFGGAEIKPEEYIDSVTALGKTEQRNLPKGYIELEYIEGTGTQYIDTGYVPNVNTETKINFLTTTLPSSDAYMFHSSDGGDARVSLAITQHLIFFGDDLTETTNRITLPRFTANTAYDITVNKDKAIVNGTEYNFTHTSVTLPTMGSMGLFGSRRGTLKCQGRVKSFSCNENNVLKINLIPARRNSDNVLGMYDTVSGTFFTNAGTGEFIAGPAVTIPEEYTQIDYVYMLSNSYLLTDIIPVYNGHYEIDFQTLAVSTTNGTILGGRTEVYGGLLLIPSVSASGNFIIDAFDSTASGRFDSGVVAESNTRYKFVYNNQVATLYRNDTSVVTHTFTSTNSNGAILCIKGRSDSGVVDSTAASLYVYSFKAWDSAGNLIADYIPCRRQTTIGFYDSVSGQFLTATAGVWNSGPVSTKSLPNPDKPVDIWCNNGVLKARHQSGLPLGYTLLDSVVFDSTQVIDTGFIPDNNSRIESKLYKTGADCWLYGAGPTSPCVTLYHSSTGTSRWGNQSRLNFGFVADTEYTLVQDKNGLNINGVDNPWTSGTAGDFTCDRSLTIGNCNGATGTRYFAGNLYYMKIYDNDVLVRNFVPCQNASNVVGLYDTVNGVFYTDTGLVAGTAVSDPVEIYTDGTVETITDALGNTATAEILLNANTYTDEQEIISGQVTKNLDVKVFNGTENWTPITNNHGFYYGVPNDDACRVGVPLQSQQMYCTHFNFTVWPDNSIPMAVNSIGYNISSSTQLTNGNITIRPDTSVYDTVEKWKAFLAEQYANGTPVIVVRIANQATESVAGQVLKKEPLTVAGALEDLTVRVTSTEHTTPTPDYPLEINSNNGILKVNSQGQIYTDGVVETIKDSLNNTATAEMLLKVGNSQDQQEIIDGTVTRKVGVKVFDGTEEWLSSAISDIYSYVVVSGDFSGYNRNAPVSTHYIGSDATNTVMPLYSVKIGPNSEKTKISIYIKTGFENNLAGFKQFLAEQYAAGTPVIVIYPLATPTTESVTGQPLQVQAGDNTLEITQASMDGLELEAQYQKWRT